MHLKQLSRCWDHQAHRFVPVHADWGDGRRLLHCCACKVIWSKTRSVVTDIPGMVSLETLTGKAVGMSSSHTSPPPLHFHPLFCPAFNFQNFFTPYCTVWNLMDILFSLFLLKCICSFSSLFGTLSDIINIAIILLHFLNQAIKSHKDCTSRQLCSMSWFVSTSIIRVLSH